MFEFKGQYNTGKRVLECRSWLGIYVFVCLVWFERAAFACHEVVVEMRLAMSYRWSVRLGYLKSVVVT